MGDVPHQQKGQPLDNKPGFEITVRYPVHKDYDQMSGPNSAFAIEVVW